MATILDVIDNFATTKGSVDFARMPGKVLAEFGDSVRQFCDSYTVPALDVGTHPIYIGGWPSANYWSALSGPLAMSSLLYSGPLLAKDPISDWFSYEQYQIPQMESVRPGFIGESGQFDAISTRGFLAAVVPGLIKMRPLIESGAVVLAPSHRHILKHNRGIDSLTGTLRAQLSADPLLITRQFKPSDLVVDDNRRGLFAFAGGNAEEQLRRAIARALRFYAREWSFANHHGAEYVAPFPFEQYVSQYGLERALFESGSQRVVHALWRSRLPVFAGLTPKVVASVRNDDTFAEFRQDLFNAYRDIPFNSSEADLTRYIAENEEANLRPKLKRAEQEAKRGFLARMGVRFTDAAYALASTVAADIVAGDVDGKTFARGGARYAMETLFGRNRTGPRSAWSKLYSHNSSYATELPEAREMPSRGEPTEDPWFIPKRPTMEIRVTEGSMLLEPFFSGEMAVETHAEGPYRICSCGSGLKYKYCCHGLPSWRQFARQ